jgi:predicted ATPase
MRAALARHDAVLTACIDAAGGRVFKHLGDGAGAAFGSASQAVVAALEAQLALSGEPWALPRPLRVRMGLHVGEADERDGDYVGPTLNRCARLANAGHGGQVLLSAAAAREVGSSLPPGVRLRELGLCRLRDLAQPEVVFQLVHPGLPREFPELRGLAAYPNNLPAQPTPLLGREEELGELRRLLDDTRLLTLTGTGGVGKTRLGLHLGAEVLPRFPDGVWLVDLAPVTAEGLVVQTAAQALGLTEDPGQALSDQLVGYLRPRELLLILDNCEHFIDACAELADGVLRQCPRVRVLATSREPLRVPGETAWRVPSLLCRHPSPRPLEDSTVTLCQCEAVRLFVERATAARPDFEVTAQNARAVEKVCKRLDGIPLAIELAAARVRAMPVEEIAEQLDDRFRLLVSGSRTALPRQQTLRALVDWSYDLLGEAERALFACLSVFVGGWTLGAAEAVCGEGGRDVRALLFGLVDKSLVLAEEGPAGMRYRYLETIRQYASERLHGTGGAAVCAGRHGEHFAQLAEELAPQLHGTSPAEPLARLEREQPNLRAALEWAKGQPDGGGLALRLTSRLYPLWDVLGQRREACLQLGDALARSACRSTPGELRRVVLRIAAAEAIKVGDFPQAHRLGLELLESSRRDGDGEALVGGACNLAWAAQMVGDGKALDSLRDALDELGPRLSEQRARYELCVSRTWLAQLGGDYEAALRHAETALTLAQELGSHFAEANQLHAVGLLAAARGDYARGCTALRQALKMAQVPPAPDLEAICRRSLGWVLAAAGEWEAAREQCEAALRVARETGARQTELIALIGLGRAWLGLGQPDEAERVLQEGMTLCAPPNPPGLGRFFLAGLGRVAQVQGERARAEALFREALGLAWHARDQVPVAECLESLGALAVDEADAERATAFLAAAHTFRTRLGVPISPADAQAHAVALDTARRLLGEAAFEFAWAESSARAPEEAVRRATEPAAAAQPR